MKKYTYFILVLCLWFFQPGAYGQKSSVNESVSIWVNGACGHCEERIEATALKVRGVISAEWHVDEKTLHVEVNEKFKLDRLHYSLASVGHDTRELLAPDAIYNALPACCHYRKEQDEHGTGDEDHDDDHRALETGEAIVTGRVVEKHEDHVDALPGTNVYWTGTKQGVITDEEGKFEIALDPNAHYLVFSYIGYGKDSVHVHDVQNLEIEFTNTQSIEEVKVIYKVAPTRIDLSGAFDVQLLDSKELLKCACCNLSESFETNPSVDAGVTDAVTGTRQIQMLGLAGQYVQINRENMPHIRGLSTLNGLGFVPGSWIEGIQLNTGTGSVVNGFESITGQINVELKKPENSEKLYLNLFGSTEGMMEANANSAIKINEDLSTGFLLHGKYQPFRLDHNGDGFMDHPAVKNGIFMNRWSYHNDKGVTGVFGIKGVWSESMSGQVDFDHETPASAQPFWGAEINAQRLEAWMKIGKVFPNRPYSSLGFQMSGMYHNQDAYFGRRAYDAGHNSLYANLIYMGILGNTNHQYRTGASFQYDDYSEMVDIYNFNRAEAIPGIFLEYTFNYMDKFTAVSGIRTDYHNYYGIFFTPRLHLRYAPRETTVIRSMIGRGQKSANMFAENIGMLASSRQIVSLTSNDIRLEDFDPEVAWNTGISAAQEFKLAEKDGLLKLDYYYTWFISQVIMNFDRDPGAVIIENLDGNSYSHSVQALLNYELFANYHIRLAYRLNDVRMTFDDELLVKPLTPRHRAFLNMAYETGDLWMFDLTWNWQGMKRIPNTSLNPEEFQLDEWSPNFFLFNAQVSKTFMKNFDLYVGAENILNYKQQNPIIDAANPFGQYFDASLIWGPVFGRKIYAGLRLRIN